MLTNLIKPLLLFLLLQLSFFFVFIISSVSSQVLLPPYSAGQGEWNLLHESIGISAMHMQLLHNNRVIMFDRTDFGRSNLSLSGGRCRFDPNDTVLNNDCTAHSILYDIATNTYRPLMVHTDTWCSSGAVLPNGRLVQTGGFNDGERVVRTFTPCEGDDQCDWIEFPQYLSVRRWYATNQILPDGRVIIIGGRRQFSFEFFPKNDQELASPPQPLRLNFLLETRDYGENNLYPFVHLLPDGNLFIFANTRSILFDYKQNEVLKEFPEIPGGNPRNYPSTGSSVMLPILDEINRGLTVNAEIMICGGARNASFAQATQGFFVRAISTCGRIMVSHANPRWIMEEMPVPRVMGDMILLPTGDVLIINGARLGTAGWELARSPMTRPVIYSPSELPHHRFSVMVPSTTPRMYHSSAILLTDGRVLVGGSNPHVYYNFTNVMYPTDLSLEAYLPPYLSAEYETVRPRILFSEETLSYRESFQVRISVQEYLSASVVSVRLIAPSFTTHSFGMNQRMVVLNTLEVSHLSSHVYELSTVAPSTAEIAPPGYYLLFVVHSGIPSSGRWVQIIGA